MLSQILCCLRTIPQTRNAENTFFRTKGFEMKLERVDNLISAKKLIK